MARTARTIDKSKLLELKGRLQNMNYIHFAVRAIADKLAHQLFEEIKKG